MKNVEVWYRDGTHKDGSASCSSGGMNYNNFCNHWTKLVDENIDAATSGFTVIPFFNIIKAGATTSFSIISPDGLVSSHVHDDGVQDDNLRINIATPIEDYYGDQVQVIILTRNLICVFAALLTFPFFPPNPTHTRPGML